MPQPITLEDETAAASEVKEPRITAH
jgi:hypothetical protein